MKKSPDRLILVGAKPFAVEFVKSDLTEWLRRTKIQRFDSATGKESWFYMFSTDHMRGFIGHSETVKQGFWDGPGWYRTRIRRTANGSWLVLDKGDIYAAMQRRFALSAADKIRFEEFVKTLGTGH